MFIRIYRGQTEPRIDALIILVLYVYAVRAKHERGYKNARGDGPIQADALKFNRQAKKN